MEKLLLKACDVAEALGISRSKVYRLMASGDLPTVRVGGQARVPAEGLKRWVEVKLRAASGTVPTAA